MQLLIILVLLLFGGKSDGQNTLSEIRPVLESLGGEEVKEALKSAEEITELLSAVQSLNGGEKDNESGDRNAQKEKSGYGNGTGYGSAENAERDNASSDGATRCEEDGGKRKVPASAIGFPLAPIMCVADKDITYSLSKYIAQDQA